MIVFDEKIKHYNLNLFYTRRLEIDAETNLLIQRIFNDFNSEYLKYVNTHIFILEYQDDILSTICYRMLKAFSSICDINLVLYGKCSKTKKYLVKKQKFISHHKAIKLMNKGKAIYISAFNPLYQVVKSDKIFNHFDSNEWQPLKSFTFSNLIAARLFYHIGYIKNDLIEDKRCYLFDNWCNQNDEAAAPDFIKTEYNNDIHLIELTENLKFNEKILQEVQDIDGIFIYKINTTNEQKREEIKQQLISFSFYLKNNSNTYGYYNDAEIIDINSFANYLNCNIIMHKYEEAI